MKPEGLRVEAPDFRPVNKLPPEKKRLWPQPVEKSCQAPCAPKPHHINNLLLADNYA
jgi:hypothetical protein